MSQSQELHSAQKTEHQKVSTEKYVHHIMVDLAKDKVRDGKEYAKLRGMNMPHPRAFKIASQNVANDLSIEMSEADRSLLLVTGRLGEFAEAQHELRLIYTEAENEGRPLTQEEQITAKRLKREYVIPFNHHLKEFVNTHPNDEIRTVSSALANSHAIIFGRYESIDSKTLIHGEKPTTPEVFGDIQASLDGMRHEVAAETLFDAAGYSIDRNVSTQEDATGSDLFVYLESGWEPVDVKASQTSANKAQSSRYASNAVWTGLGWEDFKGTKGTGHGTLSIPYDVAVAKCDDFIDRVRATVARSKAQRSSTVRNVSQRAVRHSRS